MIDEIVPSLSLSAFLKGFEELSASLESLPHLISNAEEAFKALGGTDFDELLRDPRSGRVSLFQQQDGPPTISARLNAACWDILMRESGLMTFMDSKKREEWRQSVRLHNLPQLSAENIVNAFKELHGCRQEMFELGVVNVFRGLSWRFKTNDPVKFKKRLIIRCLFNASRMRSSVHLSLNTRAADELDDLLRVFTLCDQRPEPDFRQRIYLAIEAAQRAGENHISNPYFTLRWFLKGTGHIEFLRPDLVDELNRIVARRHPMALPE